MKHCPYCGANHPDDVATCPLDGETLVDASGSPPTHKLRKDFGAFGQKLHRLLVLLLRLVWLLVLFAYASSLATGRAANPLHPYNLILGAATLIGNGLIWFPSRPARMLSGVCGIVVALMTAFQVWTVLTMFSPIVNGEQQPVHWTAYLGPFEFEGSFALVAMWVPPTLLLLVSAALVFCEIQNHLPAVVRNAQEDQPTPAAP